MYILPQILEVVTYRHKCLCVKILVNRNCTSDVSKPSPYAYAPSNT